MEQNIKTPQEQLANLSEKMRIVIRRQQLNNELLIQQTLQQANTVLLGAETLDLLAKEAEDLEAALNGESPPRLEQLQYGLKKLCNTVCTHLRDTEQESNRLLQQTIGCLYELQTTMANSLAYARMAEIVQQYQPWLENLQDHNSRKTD